ncbi:MAG: endonuclease V [Acidobacteria bacterium]|nr:endonuclease V [Acidobacteriota bacterium]
MPLSDSIDSEAARAFFPGALEGAAELQRLLAARVVEAPLRREIRTVMGADLAYHGATDSFHVAVVLIDLKSRETIATATHTGRAAVPYVPGFLSFREGPPVIEALARLGVEPDILLCDGHGRAHPRRFGLACHLGVATEIPSIGVGKSLLVGTYREPSAKRGASTALVHRGELVGRALRTRDGVKPVFVSVGTGITLEQAVALVLRLSPRFRVPEPIRRAHSLVTALRRKAAE